MHDRLDIFRRIAPGRPIYSPGYATRARYSAPGMIRVQLGAMRISPEIQRAITDDPWAGDIAMALQGPDLIDRQAWRVRVAR